MTLFDPDRHDVLTATSWSEAAVRAAIERILEDVHRGYAGVDALWPVHPITAVH